MKNIFLFLCFFYLLYNSASATCADELNIIKQNYLQSHLPKHSSHDPLLQTLLSLSKEQYISDQMVVELHQLFDSTEEEVQKLLSGLQSDGSWKDIDYTDSKRSGWQPKVHTERILVLSKAYSNPHSPFYQSSQIATALHQALAFWFEKKLVCPNWWYNQIGIPKTLGPAFILFEKQLTSKEREAAVNVMKNSKFGMTGQNKVWLAGNILVRALLEKDWKLIQKARDTIVSEITTGQQEGIKNDWSFHQHGPQQQFGNYGAAYMASLSYWSNIFAGTSLQLQQHELKILSNLLHNGFGRILWHGYMDINALGRQLFHNAQRHKALTIGFAARTLAKADLSHRSGYEKLISENFASASTPPSNPGLYHFWQSDHTVQRCTHWMASIKMASRRVVGAESGNGDNKKGYYLADGALYIYVDGDEYLNIFPYWDWRKIPGITCYQTDTPLKQLSWLQNTNPCTFVGNVSNGKEGITSMVFKREGIRAHKSWILTQEYILCLGSGISADSGLVVTTSIQQCNAKNELLYLHQKQWRPISRLNYTVQDGKSRFFHDKTGYILLQPANGAASIEKRKGQWHEIMQLYPAKEVTGDVMSIYLDHGKNPNNASYQYLILPAKEKKQVKNFDISNLQVLQNDTLMQAVCINKNKTFFIAAYQPGTLQLTPQILFENQTAGLFLIEIKGKELVVTASDPTQTHSTLLLKINRKSHPIHLPAAPYKGTSVMHTIEL